MDIQNLRISHAVAVNGGFYRAAAQLYLAQPTITKNVQALENKLGIRLIERSSKRFELTEKGVRVKNSRRYFGEI